MASLFRGMFFKKFENKFLIFRISCVEDGQKMEILRVKANIVRDKSDQRNIKYIGHRLKDLEIRLAPSCLIHRNTRSGLSD